MLKRSGAILLTMLYVVTVVGFALNLHYCGKVITSIQVDALAKPCANKQMAAKMKCCTQKQVDVKIKDVHQGESSPVLAKIFHFNLPHFNLSRLFMFAPQSILKKFFDNGPPRSSSGSISLLIKNCIFRI